MYGRLLVLSAVSIALAVVPAQTQTIAPHPTLGGARSSGEPERELSLEWQVFSSSEGRFQVQMPGIPRGETQTVDFLSLYVARSQTPRDNFLIAYADYPREIVERQDPDPILQGVQQGFISRLRGDVLVERSLELSGYPGREIRYHMTSGGEGIARFYLVDERLYQVVVSTPSAPTVDFSENADRFLDSFRLQ